MKNILDRNQNKAEEVRNLLRKEHVAMINFISSPGAGKTTLLERTIASLDADFRIGVIEGDITTDRDARRLQKYNIPITLINTEGGCHLDSHSISKALGSFNLEVIDVILIENVGNLICPSQFDLGENFKVALVSTAEGDDKPAKYPMLFREAEAVILNKVDLLPYTNFSMDDFRNDLMRLNPVAPFFEISCTRGDGLESWYHWIREKLGDRFRI
ncbi:MAG TPA: hydrogenase nickel incorporation protein HypB [Bacteroidales bacterium]|nr:hydrogenase nickel incorporation protein HypB [Bacteroidales bacterium]